MTGRASFRRELPAFLGLAAMPLAALLLPSCSHPECAFGDYSRAECRVVAEGHYARLLTSTGAELRFQEPSARDTGSWDALGLLQESGPGIVRARPAGLADFALSLEGEGPEALSLVLDNVAPDVVVSVGPAGAEEDLPLPDPPVLSRSIDLDLDGEPIWVRGRRPCPDAFRLLAAGDVQTNPIQFERVVQAFHGEVDRGEEAGEPVMGMLLLGDLSESSEVDELEMVQQILQSSPIPVAVVPGNHDVAGDDAALFNRWFGPGNYAMQVCGSKVVMLDSGNAELAHSVEARLPEMLDRQGLDHLVVATHYPAYPDRDGSGFRDRQQAAWLLSELAGAGADRVLAGHIHAWRDYPDVPVGGGTVHQVISGTAGATQGAGVAHYGVTRLSFDGGVRSCFVEMPPPGYGQDGPERAPHIDYCEE